MHLCTFQCFWELVTTSCFGQVYHGSLRKFRSFPLGSLLCLVQCEGMLRWSAGKWHTEEQARSELLLSTVVEQDLLAPGNPA